MTTTIEQLIDISPSQWPNKTLRVQPGDLRLFAPPGRLDAGLLPGSEAAHDNRANQPVDPFQAAPLTAAVGGTVYLGGDPAADDLAGLLRLLRMDGTATDYAAFAERAANPLGQRYLTQLRLVRAAALVGIYGALSLEEMRSFPAQRLSIGDLLPAFIAAERERWSQEISPGVLRGLGTLGSQVAETLGFAAMVENAHYGVYRLWSRVWLKPR
jgi:hypothetical protein